jgi:NADPH:quinone reductase
MNEVRINHAVEVHQIGGRESLLWRERSGETLRQDEVRIQQRAIGVNYIDVYHRTGYYPQALPFVPGVEGAGVVLDVGSEVREFKRGDRVAYAGVIGGYQEVRNIPADRLLLLPAGISDELGAAMLLQGMTAQVLLTQVYQVQAGDTILVHAAAGGTGLILCQWAASLGATVIGTVSNHEKAALARQHGCAHVLIHSEQDLVESVKKITGGHKVPVVYDSIGRDTFMLSLDCLAPRGLMVSFGQASGPVAPLDPTVLAQKGSLYLTRPTVFTFISSRDGLLRAYQELLDKVLSGAIRIDIKHRYPLSAAARAHEDLESRKTVGPLILIP